MESFNLTSICICAISIHCHTFKYPLSSLISHLPSASTLFIMIWHTVKISVQRISFLLNWTEVSRIFDFVSLLAFQGCLLPTDAPSSGKNFYTAYTCASVFWWWNYVLIPQKFLNSLFPLSHCAAQMILSFLVKSRRLKFCFSEIFYTLYIFAFFLLFRQINVWLCCDVYTYIEKGRELEGNLL